MKLLLQIEVESDSKLKKIKQWAGLSKSCSKLKHGAPSTIASEAKLISKIFNNAKHNVSVV